jgi:hypothetical protein
MLHHGMLAHVTWQQEWENLEVGSARKARSTNVHISAQTAARTAVTLHRLQIIIAQKLRRIKTCCKLLHHGMLAHVTWQ